MVHPTAEAPEAASAYYRYGAALLYSVQDSADVFGGDMQTAAQQHDAQARPLHRRGHLYAPAPCRLCCVSILKFNFEVMDRGVERNHCRKTEPLLNVKQVH